MLLRVSSTSSACYKETETIAMQAYKVSSIEKGIHDRSFPQVSPFNPMTEEYRCFDTSSRL